MRVQPPAAAGLRVSAGQYSGRGRKPANQDFHGLCVPGEPLLTAKGIAVALADGVSSSEVARIASETAVAGFLEDYYCTPETWSVKKSAQRVLGATNAWLHAQTRQSRHRHDRDRGYVCTMSVLILKSATAHILHVGDARIYRLRAGVLEQLTDDHRVAVGDGKHYLGRALGIAPHLEIDYHSQPLEQGDVFLLMTDGVHEYAGEQAMRQAVLAHAGDLEAAAAALARLAYEQGSGDNLTVQIVRVDELPGPQAGELRQHAASLPCPPLLAAGQRFEGFRITRQLHAGSRSHVYLAQDEHTGDRVVVKIPSLDLRHDPAYLERLLMEQWIARRIDSRHVVRAWPGARRPGYLYTVSQYIEGRTLTQWMADHPHPGLEQVLAIVEQVATGLQAFHRLEILHQDLRPDNILIDAQGTATIIDMGATKVAGITELAGLDSQPGILGTAQYTAPEYFLGEGGSAQSDVFSLGVIAYQMLTGRLPYGTQVARIRSPAARQKLVYESALGSDREIPAWVDRVLAKAVHRDAHARYSEPSEFAYALGHPEAAPPAARLPLMESHPLAFWKGLCLALAIALIAVSASAVG